MGKYERKRENVGLLVLNPDQLQPALVVLVEIGKLSKLCKLNEPSKLGTFGFDIPILIFVSVFSCLRPHSVDTGWQLLPG